jgi:hypothetical protein
VYPKIGEITADVGHWSGELAVNLARRFGLADPFGIKASAEGRLKTRPSTDGIQITNYRG